MQDSTTNTGMQARYNNSI